MAVTHDRYFLDNVAGWILEVDKGQCMPYQGNYTAWIEHKASRLTKEDVQEQAKKRRLDAELKWIRSQPKGNRGRDKGRIRGATGVTRRGPRAERRHRHRARAAPRRLRGACREADADCR